MIQLAEQLASRATASRNQQPFEELAEMEQLIDQRRGCAKVTSFTRDSSTSRHCFGARLLGINPHA
jgi:hypothetical protein